LDSPVSQSSHSTVTPCAPPCRLAPPPSLLFFFTDPATPDTYTLSLHDALPISVPPGTIEHVVLPIVERYGWTRETVLLAHAPERDRKSTRLNSSHVKISYAVFCLKKKKNISTNDAHRPKQSDLTITTNTRQHMS